VEIDFESLKQLQHIDVELKEISAFLTGVPALFQDIEKKIVDSLQVVSEARDRLAANQKKRRDLEAEVQDTKSLITKYKRQLGEVKTNREYTSLLHEIEEAEKKADALEENIISEMLGADEIEEDIKKATEKAKEAQKILDREKDTLLKKKTEQEEVKKKIIQERENLIPKIPRDQMILYASISKKNNGIALSPVNGEFCSMCHMRIRPQILNELKEASSIILCENCGRILHF
jgi:predicted  nucleic acid-binding Zn-ribbon protein